MFIIFEGIDFAGKSTLIHKLKENLENDSEFKKRFSKIICTKEPGSEHLEFCKKISEEILCRKTDLN